MLTKIGVTAAIGLLAAPALADTSTQSIQYRPRGAWTVDVPATASPQFSASSPVQFVYLDNQVHEARDGTEDVYTAYRIKILTTEGLPSGNVTVTWQPEQGPATVHYVHLIRGSQVIDVLATTKFAVIQREEHLEQSTLTGQRTAILQIPGVQVGDEVAVALTIQRHDKAFGSHSANVMQMPILGSKGTFRFRLLWPEAQNFVVRASRDVTLPPPADAAGEHILDLVLHDPSGAIPTDGAPARFNLRRMVEFSNYAHWADLSRQLAPLFERAATIEPNSPLNSEISAIASRSRDPTQRTQAALQLVEDRIRYVYVGLNGGNYLPAGADETWQRRFGDCKGKAVLLVAVLRKLGIDALPVLVNSKGGDGLDQLLPGQEWFDHVIVKAKVAGKDVWLDGTRLGDRYLDNLALPYRWGLPLSSQGSGLEKIEIHDIALPTLVGLADIDATAGVDQDARVTLKNILHGPEAFAIRTRLAALSADDADRALKNYWHQQADWVTPDHAGWAYDERRQAITLSLVGRGNPGWKGDAVQGHSLTIPGAGFYKPDALRRPADQDQSASWSVEYPSFRCWATTIRLPRPTNNLGWSLYADAMNRKLGGTAYWRASGFDGGVVRTVMSRHNFEPEASPQEASAVNQAIPGFNDNMSNISEEPRGSVLKSSSVLPFKDDVDWVNDPVPCRPG